MNTNPSHRQHTMKQCEATTQSTNYSEPHQCLKNAKVKIGKRYFCSHHRRAKIPTGHQSGELKLSK